MEKINLDEVFETTDISAMGEPCLSDEDCKEAEEINQTMRTVCRAYSSMVAQSYQLCAGLRLTRRRNHM